MDQATSVGHLLDRCKRFIEGLLQDTDTQTVATASLAIFARMREVAHALLQANIALEAQRRKKHPVAPCCPGAALAFVHTRTVHPTTLFGQVEVPMRTLRCQGCGATVRPDDTRLGVPPSGDFTDEVRLYLPGFVTAVLRSMPNV
jgi:hypothetical protein